MSNPLWNAAAWANFGLELSPKRRFFTSSTHFRTSTSPIHLLVALAPLQLHLLHVSMQRVPRGLDCSSIQHRQGTHKEPRSPAPLQAVLLQAQAQLRNSPLSLLSSHPKALQHRKGSAPLRLQLHISPHTTLDLELSKRRHLLTLQLRQLSLCPGDRQHVSACRLQGLLHRRYTSQLYDLSLQSRHLFPPELHLLFPGRLQVAIFQQQLGSPELCAPPLYNGSGRGQQPLVHLCSELCQARKAPRRLAFDVLRTSQKLQDHQRSRPCLGRPQGCHRSLTYNSHGRVSEHT